MSENQKPQQQVDQSAIKSPSPLSSQAAESKTPDYAPYPKLDLQDVSPPSENWADVSMTGASAATPPPPPPPPPPSSASHSAPAPSGPTPIPGDATATTMPAESNPYVSPAPASKNKMDAMKDVLGKWGKKAAEATKKAEDLAGNVWQHLKTGPSFADAAVGRIAQSTKVLAEGGYEKVFKQTFEGLPDEQLTKTYACYLSTSAGPVMGTLYLSTAKLAFCSDNPLSYQVGDQTQWSYYKVVIPLHQLKAVNPSISKINSSEKYIQIISIDNHEFWLMGFVNYESAVKNLQEAVPHPI